MEQTITDNSSSIFRESTVPDLISEEEKLRKWEEANLLRQRRNETAEEEAHKKDTDVLEFENQLLEESVSSKSYTSKQDSKSSKDSSGGVDKKKKKSTISNSDTCISIFLKVVAYWDIVLNACNLWQLMCIVTYLHYQQEAAIVENMILQNYYNCPESVQYIGYQIKFLYMMHSGACLVLVYAINAREPSLMIIWLMTKSIVLMSFGFRQAFDLRLKEGHLFLKNKKIYFTLGALIFYCVQIVIVLVSYMKYKKPYIERRRLLQSSRALNRDIHMKTLPPFLQQKYAVKWAEKMQARVVLQKIQERRKQKRKVQTYEELDLTPLDLETEIQAFRSVYGFDHSDVTAGDKI